MKRALALIVVMMTGCGGDGGNTSAPPTPHVADIAISPPNATLRTGATLQLSAEARDRDGNALPQLEVTWSSRSPSIASVSNAGLVTASSAGTTTISATIGGVTASTNLTVQASYDLDALGPPRIVEADYIELAKIARISRFRSGIGHDYADDIERCRSMKHYFQPFAAVDWSGVVIRSPIDGTVREILDEQTFGKQLRLVSTTVAAATVTIFHVKPDSALVVGSRVSPGTRLGTHVGSQTMSDIAIWLDTPRGRRLVSYFDAMTDAVFAPYAARGVSARGITAIGAAERDANPLVCNGEAFAGPGALPNWVDLH